MFFKVIRFVLGNIILLVDKLTQPRPQKRSKSAQTEVLESVSNWSLYQFKACPFCVKTRRAMRRLNLPITTVDAKKDPYRQELITQGGSLKVPCLRIEKGDQVEWMYESSEIIAYLEKRFA